jgi:putative hemolysin
MLDPDRRRLRFMMQSAELQAPAALPLETCFAACDEDVREVERLRYRVFAEDGAVRLPTAALGLDCDRFDPHCRHLMVRDRHSGRVAGTYRILEPDGARAAGGLYAETEFDLRRLEPLRSRLVEVGRACVHPDYRNGVVISLLWAGLLRHFWQAGYEYVIGCGSVAAAEDGALAAAVCRRVLTDHLASERWRVFPRRPFPLEGWMDLPDVPLPPLIRAYLRLGASACGDPAWDDAFGTADLLLLLPLERMQRRYVERFLRCA